MNQVKSLSLKNIVVLFLILIILTLAYFSLDILMMLFASFVITCAINPLINKMETKIPRILAVTLVLLGLILTIFLILVPLISISIREISGFSGTLEGAIDGIDKLLGFQLFGKTISDFVTFESLKDTIAQGLQGIVENSIIAGKWIANFATTVFAISIMTFYFAYDQKHLTDKFIEFFPQEKKKRAKDILENIASKVGNYVFAQGIAMVFVGALTAIGLLLIHNNHAFLLGVITCVFDIIPVIGPTCAVAIGLISSVSGGFLYVLLTFAIYMVAQWAQNQLLRPIVFGKLLNMHPLAIIVALLISARFLGIFGVILSPAIACVICVLVDELYLNRLNNKIENPIEE